MILHYYNQSYKYLCTHNKNILFFQTSIGDESMTTLISKSTLSPTNTKGVRLQMIRRLINMAERYVSAVEESHLGNRNLRPHATTFYGPPIQIKVIYESKKDEFMIEVRKKKFEALICNTNIF